MEKSDMNKKLQINRETIRRLSDHDLDGVHGGNLIWKVGNPPPPPPPPPSATNCGACPTRNGTCDLGCT
jgi:hypothetical protein